MPVRGNLRGRNPLGQHCGRFQRARTFGGSVVAVDTVGEVPRRFHEEPHVIVIRPGRTPGLMETELTPGTRAPGTRRAMYRPTVSPVPAPPPFEVSAQPTTLRRATRYSTRSFYRPAGSTNTRFIGLHTVIRQAVRSKTPSRGAGGRIGRPTLRNRMSSFGSRVPPLNPRVKGAQNV